MAGVSSRLRGLSDGGSLLALMHRSFPRPALRHFSLSLSPDTQRLYWCRRAGRTKHSFTAGGAPFSQRMSVCCGAYPMRDLSCAKTRPQLSVAVAIAFSRLQQGECARPGAAWPATDAARRPRPAKRYRRWATPPATQRGPLADSVLPLELARKRAIVTLRHIRGVRRSRRCERGRGERPLGRGPCCLNGARVCYFA